MQAASVLINMYDDPCVFLLTCFTVCVKRYMFAVFESVCHPAGHVIAVGELDDVLVKAGFFVTANLFHMIVSEIPARKSRAAADFLKIIRQFIGDGIFCNLRLRI